MNINLILVSAVIFLPLIGFIINGIGGLFFPGYRCRKKIVYSVAIGVMVLSFMCSLWLLLSYSQPFNSSLWTLIHIDTMTIPWGYHIDALSLLMALVVTGVGGIIHVYSIGYMSHDEGYWKFFAYLNLFIFAMLNLILADNLVILFLGWEGVGLCSYLLIGFWYKDLSKSGAARKAFVYNRIGDAAFLVAIFIIYNYIGSVNISVIMNNINTIPSFYIALVCILLFVASTGKSAQIPLFVWLPDAMAGPTPVSALIHAATMVTSGIYLISRFSFMYITTPMVMMIVAGVGVLTAIIAATMALNQKDIKKVLAYSTISQLGYMFLALGSGAFTAAMFHVVTHAFFKACLFLGSGSVIHAMEHAHHILRKKDNELDIDVQNINFMGGLKKKMPHTYRTFLISTIAISGIPPLAGFFSKDEILASAANGVLAFSNMYIVFYALGIITAFLTALYMFRLLFSVFHGSIRLNIKTSFSRQECLDTITENPRVMTIPLFILAGLAIFGGLLGIPNFFVETFTHETSHIHLLHSWLSNVVYDQKILLSHATEWLLMLLSIIIAFGGAYIGYYGYCKLPYPSFDEKLSMFFGMFYRLWQRKYYIDEIYRNSIEKGMDKISKTCEWIIDVIIIENIIHRIFISPPYVTGYILKKAHQGYIHRGLIFFMIGVLILLYIIILY